MNTEAKNAGLNDAIVNQLTIADQATRRLTAKGIKVIAAMANGRRPLLMVDAMPEGVVTAVKQKYPNGQGGTTLVHAATFFGCQLEYMQDVYSESQAAAVHAAPRLEVVRG